MLGARTTSVGVALLLLAGGLARAAPVRAQVTTDPRATWLTVRSDHFVIHYHEPLGVAARRVAFVAERAHAILTRVLRNEPGERTHIVIHDGAEGPNGFAFTVPYNHLELIVTGPDDIGLLNDYDDWMGVLTTHEYAHVLHIDRASGVPELANMLLGKTYLPNARLPGWFVEGLAVYEESSHSSGGRLRSRQGEMFLRMAALEDELLTLAQISNLTYGSPGGDGQYLYGARFLAYIAGRYGDDAIADMIDDFGDELVPFGLNRTSLRHTGRSFVELYDEWQAQIRREYRAVAASIRARGIVEGTRLTEHGENTTYPTFVSDREVVYAVSADDPFALRRLDVRDGSDARVVRIAGRSGSSLHPDGRRLYYATPAPFRDRYSFFDLHVHDLVDGESERLTHGLRAESPDVSPDGRRVAFTINGAGTRHLAIASLEDIERTRHVLVRSTRFDQVYTPKWSPDGRTIAFSAWRRGGYRDIVLADVETGGETRITHDRALDTGPEWSPDGRWLYFSSDRTGIANIYAYELTTGTTMQVTNVIGGAFQPAISPDGATMVYVGFSSRGFDLWTLSIEPASFRDAVPYADDRPEPSDGAEILSLLSEAYDPLETFGPRAYSLSLGGDGTQTRMIVGTTGGDVVGYAAYEAEVGIGLLHGDVDVDLHFDWNRSPVPLRFRLYRFDERPRSLSIGGEPREWNAIVLGAALTLEHGLPAVLHSEKLRLAYALTHTEETGRVPADLDPNEPPPRLPPRGFSGVATASWSWTDVRSSVVDVAPSEGRELSLSLSLEHPLSGDPSVDLTARWAVAQYLENPLVERHVLALRYSGGLSTKRNAFGVGGYPEQDFTGIQSGELGFPDALLRGFPSDHRFGVQYHALALEYVFPIATPEWGVGTVPLYLGRIWGKVFLDGAGAFDDPFDLDAFGFGTGGEIIVELLAGYSFHVPLRLGLARGIGPDGETQPYVHLGVR